MRILLDESLPTEPQTELPGHDVRTVQAGRIVERCDVYRLLYGDLDVAIATIDDLMDGLAGGTASR